METTDRKSEITQRVIELAAGQTGVDPSTVTPDTHFVNDLNWDSLDKMDFAIKLEEEFEVSVGDEDVDDLTTVGKVIDYLMTSDAAKTARPPRSSATS